MEIFSSHNRVQFIKLYIILFYVLAVYKWLNGMWMYQMEPQFFNTRFDFVTWLFMQTGIHQWLLGNPIGWVLFDAVFYLMPMIYWFASKKNVRIASIVAGIMLFVNWVYVQCYVLYPTNSIEGYLATLLFPFLLMSIRLKTFYFLLHGLRYFFLFFFASAALWKFYQGGIFNTQQMSGILLMQHREFLVTFPGHWYSQITYWIIRRQWIGHTLYIAATIIELSFAVGFFTRKYDRQLLFLFGIFLVTDFFVMRIPYFEILPLCLPLLFSKYTEPLQETQIPKITSIA
jgi:hypothetical protein